MPRLFTEAFRVFFLAAGLFAAGAMALWLGWLALHDAPGAVAVPPFAVAPHLWHAHEMLFGYAAASVAGFFLTAAPNWTGSGQARGGYVTLAAAVWLAGRGAMLVSDALPPTAVALIDLAFLPLLAAKLAAMLARRPKPQNVALLAALAALWGGDLLCHLDWTGLRPGAAEAGLRLGLGALCVLIAVIGGRVTPAFTRNAMRRDGVESGLPRSLGVLEAIAIGGACLTTALWALGDAGPVASVAALGTGVAQLGRAALWRPLWALRQPILWSLHLGMTMLGLGWLALGLGWAGLAIPESAALHLLAIGAVGGMTLAMMSRAALGHTGRPLRAPTPVALAYALVALSALIRFAGPVVLPVFYAEALRLAALLWITAFALFALSYWPILTGPRRA